MVVGIDVRVKEGIAGGNAKRVEHDRVAPLAEVGGADERAVRLCAQLCSVESEPRRRVRRMRRRSRSDLPPHTP